MIKTDLKMGVIAALHLDTTELSDNDIIDLVLEGKKEWFEVLIQRNNQRLFRVIRGYIRNEEEARDVMQNTYLKSYLNLPQFNRDSAFSTWLIRIGINEALMRLRKLNQKRDYISYVRADIENDSLPSDIEPMNPEKRAMQHETEKFIEEAVDRLPEKYRTVYIMREVEGLDHKEIAHCLDLTESNVKVRLHRAKALLQKELYDLSADVEIFKFGGHHCHSMRKTVMEKIHLHHQNSDDW